MQDTRLQGHTPLSAGHRGNILQITACVRAGVPSPSSSSSRHALMAKDPKKMKACVALSSGSCVLAFVALNDGKLARISRKDSGKWSSSRVGSSRVESSLANYAT
ncbi:uncharacterized protein LOC108135650 isoform X2 [Drosophila elegans]|uniref:uncharacterized protein LOC108135650 isoform X2 n=1 Tax=Drosophila elegans TaxID=30023 RepID=UPI0007E5DFD4|nr:uncharacterized protein LOC108135650 isoform X2 [Drosophila elegans]